VFLNRPWDKLEIKYKLVLGGIKLPEYREIPLEKIIVGKNPVRTSPLDVKDFRESIKKDGILQPILVQPSGDKYEIISDCRRYIAQDHYTFFPCHLSLTILRSLEDETGNSCFIQNKTIT
jgi:hypothetical protein